MFCLNLDPISWSTVRRQNHVVSLKLHGGPRQHAAIETQSSAVPQSHMKTLLYLELFKVQAHVGIASHSQEFAG